MTLGFGIIFGWRYNKCTLRCDPVHFMPRLCTNVGASIIKHPSALESFIVVPMLKIKGYKEQLITRAVKHYMYLHKILNMCSCTVVYLHEYMLKISYTVSTLQKH